MVPQPQSEYGVTDQADDPTSFIHMYVRCGRFRFGPLGVCGSRGPKSKVDLLAVIRSFIY